MLTRLWYNNDSAGVIPSTSLTTSLPAGFALVPNSTRTCLSPDTTDPANPAPTTAGVCSTDAQQGGIASDPAVWSSGNLTISPTNGLFGTPTTYTNGPLAMGKTRYVNLQSCDYRGTWDFTTTVTTPSGYTSGTNVSNTADSSPTCVAPAGGWAYASGNSGVAALDLLGNQYLNLQSCDYRGAWDFTTTVNTPSGYTSGTNTGNTPDTSPSCAPPAGGWGYAPDNSGAVALDMLTNRYLNLQSCDYRGAWDFTTTVNTLSGYAGSTHASNTPDTTLACAPPSGGWAFAPANSGAISLDTLDTTRGEGFVEFTMIAPTLTTTQTFPQDSMLNGAGTNNPASSGTVTVNPELAIPLIDEGVAAAVLFTGLLAAGVAVYRRRQTTE
ncbi:hypothetical protein ACFCYM_34955 [Streptomyces sp. NPDC056254]|uniref:hypothetical protein n=1 Tax=Streptomyces sp. NPDC056254 TaxID=3345763 RepID=UPI0035E1E212